MSQVSCPVATEGNRPRKHRSKQAVGIRDCWRERKLKSRVLIAEAAQKEAERKQKCAEKERLEAATTLVQFSQQVFIKEQSTQTETASPSKTVANCSTQTDDVTTVVKESEQLKRKLQSSIFRATII